MQETLEFLIGGDVADRPDAAVHVEVWDNTFVADDEASRFLILMRDFCPGPEMCSAAIRGFARPGRIVR